MKKKICVVTGTRAEYNLLYGLIRLLHDDPAIELQLAVTCMHLAKEFGNTYQYIEKDGFSIDAMIDMLLVGDIPSSTAKSMGLGIVSFSDYFARTTPDVIILLGDRFEALSVAATASVLKIPVAHIHGGEVTTGAIDDTFRHCITKIATLHFTSTARYRQRVIQMGEDPVRVFNVGSLGVDNTIRFESYTPEMLETHYQFPFTKPYFLINYYSETNSAEDLATSVETLFFALDHFPDFQLVFTKANADFGGRFINQQIEYFVSRNSRAQLFDNFDQHYLSVARHAAVMIGNSSSGIFEAPAVNTPTVNIGRRQEGRLSDASVLHVPMVAKEIQQAIQRALDPQFLQEVFSIPSVYGKPGEVSQKIYEILKQTDFNALRQKQFYDLPGVENV